MGDSARMKETVLRRSRARLSCGGHRKDWVVVVGAFQAEEQLKNPLMNFLFPLLTFSVFRSLLLQGKTKKSGFGLRISRHIDPTSQLCDLDTFTEHF